MSLTTPTSALHVSGQYRLEYIASNIIHINSHPFLTYIITYFTPFLHNLQRIKYCYGFRLE